MARRKRNVLEQSDAIAQGYYLPHLYAQQTAGTQTSLIEMMLWRMLLEISLNRFKWEGLPKEVNIRWMEMALCKGALSVFLFDRRVDRYFALPGSGKGPLNMVGDFIEFLVWGNPEGTRTVAAEDVVPIWANYTRIPDLDIIAIYAHRLAELDRTIEINSMNARRSKILSLTENGSLTAKMINDKIEAGAAAIPTSNGVDIGNMVQALDLGVDPATILNVSVLRSRIWQEAMMMLGVNGANQDKKERLVAAEVSGNDDMVAAIRATNLQARQQACEQINDKYPELNVSVDYVTTEVDVATNGQQGAIEEGAGND
jgi:Phage Connector (GP10)